jgi:hypothetical protein
VNPGWLTQDGPSGVNVLPVDDIIVHVESSACPCAPRVEWIGYTCHDHGDGGVAAARQMIVHEAMDGREE